MAVWLTPEQLRSLLTEQGIAEFLSEPVLKDSLTRVARNAGIEIKKDPKNLTRFLYKKPDKKVLDTMFKRLSPTYELKELNKTSQYYYKQNWDAIKRNDNKRNKRNKGHGHCWVF